MQAGFEKLIEVLREELVLYGEALALLEQQRNLIVRQAAGDLLENVEAISAQFQKIGAARKLRDDLHKELACCEEFPTQTPLRSLIATASPNLRPLLQALVEEINDLLVRSQNRLLGNNLLLRRAVATEFRTKSLLGKPRDNRPTRLSLPIGCRASLARLMTSRCSPIDGTLSSRKKIAAHSNEASH